VLARTETDAVLAEEDDAAEDEGAEEEEEKDEGVRPSVYL
jgi:hypothetical protein